MPAHSSVTLKGKLMSNVGRNKRNDAPVQSPEPLHPGIARAREQLSKGDSDGAAATLRQLVKQADLSLNTRVEAAKLLNTAGAQTDAINVYLDIGRKALEAGDVPAARTSLSAAHTLDQKNYDALFELGRADLAEGKKEEALAKFVEVLRKSNLRHLPALYEAAVLYEADGQSDQAILAYKKIAERDRHHVPTLTRLAVMHRKKGQLGEALGYYIAAARAAFQTMHFAEARKLVDEAMQIEDDNWEARRLLADINKADPEPANAKEARPSAAAPARPAPPAPAPQPARPASASPVQPLRQPAVQPATQPQARPATAPAPAARPAAQSVQPVRPAPQPAQAVQPVAQPVQPAVRPAP
ncbi:MAG TPA: tetratricopeptide repeat protein, partial [Candidatus Eremiobacteraceae bacterium]|nr:tetratricopeptide repeat protein [Candidatus Eremiobacteraceae bacterium]